MYIETAFLKTEVSAVCKEYEKKFAASVAEVKTELKSSPRKGTVLDKKAFLVAEKLVEGL